MSDEVINIKSEIEKNVSEPLKNAKTNTKEVNKEMKISRETMNKWETSMRKTFVSSVKSAGKSLKSLGKIGLSEAMDLEEYKLQLEWATKDTQRAAELMKYAINMVSETPFKTSELVNASSSLEAMGLNTERWLPVLGDAALGASRSMEDIKEGFIKAVTIGDFQTLEDSLGITKEMVEEYAKMNFGESFLNSQGQVADINLLQDSLEELLNSKYKGSMDALSNSTRGMWSNMVDVTRTSLAEILGMTDTGTIRQGSFYDMLRDKIALVADTLRQWKEDGTLEKIGDVVANVATVAIDGLSSAITFLRDNIDWLIPLALFLLSAFSAFEILTTIGQIAAAFGFIMSGLTISLLPVLGIIAAIAGGITLLYLAYREWKKGGFDGYETGSLLPTHATGTPYFKGGATSINEGGRTEMVVLPSGSTIIPSDKTRKALQANSEINVNVNIQGNVLGNKEYAEEIGTLIAKRVRLAYENS